MDVEHLGKGTPVRRWVRRGAVAVLALGLGGCANLSLPGLSTIGGGGSGTNGQSPPPSAALPSADDRGVISFGRSQALRVSETQSIADVAAAFGQDPDALAAANGFAVDDQVRPGVVLVLPSPVPAGQSAPATSEDLAEISIAALDRASASAAAGGGTADVPADVPVQRPPPLVPDQPDPVQHRVERGETAYSIARLYNVSVRALADWNGLSPDFQIREGQMLLIPLPRDPGERTVARPTPPPVETAAITAPGLGSPTPLPPSSQTPLPDPVTVDPGVADAEAGGTPAPVAVAPLEAPRTAASDTGRFVTPVQGTIFRPYAKGQNEGVDFAADAGTPVRAAEAGTVAAITQDVDQVPIVVLRHADNVLTVYANVDNIQVVKGDTVARGQDIAVVRAGDPSFLHFEVREGFDSVDPLEYIR